MSKRARRVETEDPEPDTHHTKDLRPIEAKTQSQGHYLLSIDQNIVTFGVGPAGTGKTFLAAARAADALRERRVKRVIVTRPVQEAGERLGFLPGELDDKFAPYFQPVKDVFARRLGTGPMEYALKKGQIMPLPLAYMRGHSFDDTFVLFDEAQNATPVQLKLLLTRIGHNCKVVVTGDPNQADIANSGLMGAMHKIDSLNGVGAVEFDRKDIVRSGIVQRIVEAYEKDL